MNKESKNIAKWRALLGRHPKHAARELHQQNVPMKELAEKFEVSEATIACWVRKTASGRYYTKRLAPDGTPLKEWIAQNHPGVSYPRVLARLHLGMSFEDAIKPARKPRTATRVKYYAPDGRSVHRFLHEEGITIKYDTVIRRLQRGYEFHRAVYESTQQSGKPVAKRGKKA